MPETQHHNIDFVFIATATTPAAAIQGIKPRHKPASKAPGLIKSLATSAARRTYRNIGKHHRPDGFNDPKDHATPILVSRLQRASQRSRNINRWQ